MKILTRKDGIAVSKPNGTDVVYHIFSEYEIHFNELAPGAEQEWHHHTKIEEVLYLIDGTLQALWVEDGALRSELLTAGDVVRVEDNPHTFANPSTAKAVFLVFRFVPDGSDQRELIKGDKKMDNLQQLLKHGER